MYMIRESKLLFRAINSKFTCLMAKWLFYRAILHSYRVQTFIVREKK